MAGGNKIKSENSIGSVEQKDRTMRGGGGGEQHHPHGGGERKQQQLIKEERDSPLRAGGENSDRNAKSNLSMASAAALVSREDKKFTGRCRLFVGNLTPDTTEDEFKKLFEPYGEISEVYVNTAKGFGFIRLDYRHNAEAAKAALDGMQRKGRTLRVRYASLGAALKVKNLSPHVSNELLEKAFSQFGEVERAVVVVDDRGRPTGEGIVEFARKPGAQQALKRITDGVFLITSAPRPVTVEPLEQKDEEDGFPEKFINKTDQYKKEREAEPRFAPPGSFEYEFGLRWKELEDLEKQQHENVKKNIEESRMKLEDEMENAMFEQQAELIRQDLMRQQEELRRLEEMRQQEQIRRRQEMEMSREDNYSRRRQEEERRRQDEERRRQDLLMRSQEIRRRQMDQGSLPRRGDEMMGGGGAAMPDNSARSGSSRGNAPPLPPPPAPPAGMGLERPGQNQMPASAGGYNYNQGMAQNIGSSQSGSSMAGAPGSMAGAMSAAPMRQSRYDQASDNNFGGSDNYGSSRIGNNAGPMGNQGPINNPGGPPNLFQSGMGGNMRGGDTNMMDNHRRREGSRRDDYGEMKRMRRY